MRPAKEVWEGSGAEKTKLQMHMVAANLLILFLLLFTKIWAEYFSVNEVDQVISEGRTNETLDGKIIRE